MEQEAQWPSRRMAWAWIAVLVLAYICSFIDRQILTLMVDRVKADLQLSDSQFGILHGFSFVMLYCILGLPLGSMVDRYSRRKIITAGVLIWSLMTALCGTAGNFWQLFLARIGVGTGEASLSPSAYSVLSDCFPKERLGRAMAIYVAGAGIGAGVALMLGGALISWIDTLMPLSLPLLGELHTWQIVFFVVALPGLPIAVLVWLLHEPRRMGRLRVEAPSWGVTLKFVGENGAFLIPFILAMSFNAAISLATLAWVPAMLMRSFHLSAAEVGWQLGFVTMGGITLGLLSGAWLNEAGVRRGIRFPMLRISLVAMVMTIPSALMLGVVKSVPAALATTCVLMIFTNIPFGIATAAVQSATPNEMRGRIGAIYQFMQNAFGMTLGPLIPALLTDHLFGGDGTRLGLSIGFTITMVGSAGALCVLVALRNAARGKGVPSQS